MTAGVVVTREGRGRVTTAAAFFVWMIGMVDKFTYGLYPWQWNPPVVHDSISDGVPISIEAAGYHSPPTGAVAVLDFRPIGDQATQGQSAGYGLFAWPDGATPPNDLISLGTGYAPTLQISSAARLELKTKLGLSALPSGATLADALADVLGPLSDPTGASGPKPVMPTSDGTLEIHLADHSRIWSRVLDIAELLSANPTGHESRIRDVIRANMDVADSVGGLALAKKALGAQLRALGFTRDEVEAGAPGKAAQWARLLSATLKAKHGAALKPARPSTMYTESWPNNCADIEATSQDQSWVTATGGEWVGTCEVSSGRVYGSSGEGYHFGRCTSSVSSDKHTVSQTLYTGANALAGGIAARMSSSANTCYLYINRHNTYNRLFKSVAGSLTLLTARDISNAATSFTQSLDANGSTITGSSSLFASDAVTDTAITGNLFGGVVHYTWAAEGPKSNSSGDSWSIDDGLNPPVADFSGTPVSGTAPLSVAFTDASTNTPTSWLWEKSSDGGSNWSNFAGTPTAQNPTEVFAAGTWAIRLTATNAGGSDGETKTAYVTVTAATSGQSKAVVGCGISTGIGH